MTIFDDRTITHDKLIELGFDKSLKVNRYIFYKEIESMWAYYILYYYPKTNIIEKIFDSRDGRLRRSYKFDNEYDIDDIILHMHQMDYKYDTKLHKWIIE